MTPSTEAVEALAARMAEADQIDWNETCGYQTDQDDCNSSTCVAAAFEDHDAEWARNFYRRFARTALTFGLETGENFLTQLRRVNTERYFAWVGGEQEAGIMVDAVELGGEVGELLNVVKKLEREERGWRGSRAGPDDFADECADVLICLDKLARRKGVDLAAATVRKFNATSEKVGLPHRLTSQRLSPNADGEPCTCERAKARGVAMLCFACDKTAKVEGAE